MPSVRPLPSFCASLTVFLLVTAGNPVQAHSRLPAQALAQAAPQVPVSAAAQVQAYFDQFRVSQFNVSLTLADFQNLPPQLRAIGLADLIAQVDHTFDGERGEQTYQAKDRDLILQTYYQGLSPAQKEQIQAWAFDFSLYYSSSPEQFAKAQQYFDQQLAKNPEQAMQRLCGAITLMAAQSIEENRGTARYGDPEKPNLSINYDAGMNLIQLVGQVPQAVDRPCQVQVGNRMISYSAREVIQSAPGSLIGDELENALEAAKKSAVPEEVVQQILYQEYSSCSDTQLRYILNQAIVEANKRPIGGRVLFARKMDSCVVDARITRLANGYDFAPRAGVRGYKDATMSFQNLEGIVSALKTHPQTFILKRLQEVRVQAQAVPAVTGQEAVPQNASADAKAWREILTDPWGKMKSIFE